MSKNQKIDNIITRFTQAEASTNTLLDLRKKLLVSYKQQRHTLSGLQQSLEAFEQELALYHAVTEQARQQAYDKISELVNFGLREIFGEATEFKILADKRGETPVCKFLIKTKEYNEFVELDKTQETHGGGLEELCGFLLQVIIHSIKQDLPHVIISDERFRQISKQNVETVALLIKQLHQMLNLQFINISHDDALIAEASKIINL